ncbi:hypothetical protein FQA39_LY07336 [Lamprigera yunnana]|nr:hypothetical protein FQA39_LY07336 [Lamprigera yunnana]
MYKKQKSLSTCRCKCLGWIPARMILYLLCLSGVTVSFIIRAAINLTILAMVKDKLPQPKEIKLNSSEELCYFVNNATSTAINYGGTLEWSSDAQYYVLTSFYWSYIIVQVLGGMAVQKFGTKIVFGYAILVSGLCNLFVPVASNLHFILVVILQIVQGAVQGLTWPAVYGVVSKWIPLDEKTRFISCFQGLTLGSGLSRLISGFIITNAGWPYVFYTFGSLGVLWSIVWYLLAHDTPETHPRISPKELYYIQKYREDSLNSEKRIPWKSILLSMPVWAIAVTCFGRMWVFSIVLIYGPQYLKSVVGLQVDMNGMVDGLSTCSGFIASLLSSFISDRIVKNKALPLVWNRRLFCGIGNIVVEIVTISLGHLGCNRSLIIAAWCLIQFFLSVSFIGAMTNIVDVSPNFSPIVTGFVQTILMSSTLFAPLTVKILSKSESTLDSWLAAFHVAGGITIVTFLFFCVFSSAKVQPWDNPKKFEIEPTCESELIRLSKKNEPDC